MDLRLAERSFIVTGGSRGIGRQIVLTLLAEGARVAAFARGTGDLDGLSSCLRADSERRLLCTAVDVRDAVAMRHAVNDVTAALGGLDGLVVNAGAGAVGAVVNTADATWQDQFEIKINGALHAIRPAIPALTRSDAGRILIINGVTAHAPEPDMAAVSAARAALASLARSLAVELGPAGVCVNAISLGAIITDRQLARHAATGTSRSFEDWCDDEALRRGVLLGRLGRPEEVAPIAALLVSPLSSYITGTSIDVSGGSGGRT
jgi:NAD(P)-dependent dehydrogenase (short-subunit alcohol dehydrogenase family)